MTQIHNAIITTIENQMKAKLNMNIELTNTHINI